MFFSLQLADSDRIRLERSCAEIDGQSVLCSAWHADSCSDAIFNHMAGGSHSQCDTGVGALLAALLEILAPSTCPHSCLCDVDCGGKRMGEKHETKGYDLWLDFTSLCQAREMACRKDHLNMPSDKLCEFSDQNICNILQRCLDI